MSGYPKLVREAHTDCVVTINSEEIAYDGSPVAVTVTDRKCNYHSSARKVHTKEKTYVEVSGACLFDGDLCPGIAEITDGKVVIFGETRTIVKGSKNRNPDGTVNYTRLELA